jgi:hypothetical protein
VTCNQLKLCTAFLASVLFSLQSCGYQLQDSSNPLGEKYGVRKVFVNSLENSTYKAGVENLVYNALVRELRSQKKLTLVNSQDDADAVITGNIGSASYSSAGGVGVSNLNGKQYSTVPIPDKESVASLYHAELSASFVLTHLNKDPVTGKKSLGKMLWNGGFSRQKDFPSNTQLGVLGTTSALINESSFERALDDLGTSMMGELHESLLSVF